MSGLLRTTFGYHAWANHELLGALAGLDPRTQGSELQAILRLIDHAHVVSRIFAAHLSGSRHPHASDRSAETPALDMLRAAVAATDQWYLDYVKAVPPAALLEAVSFTFTDGDSGRMTREEMLAHVALHSAVHRGEACRILSQLSITPPWDTLAVYLHQAEPARRRQGGGLPAPALEQAR